MTQFQDIQVKSLICKFVVTWQLYNVRSEPNVYKTISLVLHLITIYNTIVAILLGKLKKNIHFIIDEKNKKMSLKL